MAKKPQTDEISHFYDYGIHVPSRTLYMGSESDEEGSESGVDYVMAERVIKGLHLLESLAPLGDRPITIIMNNPGGDSTHGMAIYDAIKDCINHVTIEVKGNVCSMGSYILQAADERVLSKNCVFMFHAGTVGFTSQHPKIVKNWMKFYDKQAEILDKILLDRINQKRAKDNEPPMSKQQFNNYNNFDTILTAEEAIAWGLADKLR